MQKFFGKKISCTDPAYFDNNKWMKETKNAVPILEKNTPSLGSNAMIKQTSAL
jgi:hypothetical protein